jgi:membrane protein implicated in regulation of membrane protease activity
MTQQKFFSYFLLVAATFIFFYVIWNEVVSVWTGVLTHHQIFTILIVSLFAIYVWLRVLNQLKQINKK